MKKLILTMGLIVMSLILTSCKNTPSQETVKVLIPSGGPTLGFVQMIEKINKISNYEIEYEVTTSVENDLPTAITSETHQIVIAPTNLGANLYNKGAGYVFAGTVTNGNLFVVSTTSSDTHTYTIDDLDKKTIAAFGEGNIPGILLEKILKSNGYQIVDSINESSTEKQVVITYFDSISDVNPQFMAKKYQFALLAEPVLSVAKSKDTNIYTVFDIQTEYKTITNKDSYPQAGIFINKDFAKKNKTFVKEFLDKVEESTTFTNTNKDQASDYYIAHKDLITAQFPKGVLINAIEPSNIHYKNAQDSKNDLNEFLNLIYEFKPALIGNKLPDDAFYYSE